MVPKNRSLKAYADIALKDFKDKKFFEEMNVLLVDFKLEFGRDSANEIRLGDEISPDTCRFWDKTTHEKLDKDRFRRDMGGIEDAYQEMLRRVTSK